MTSLVALVAISAALAASSASAAFIVEARATAGAGKGFGNFGFGADTTSASNSATADAAVGLTSPNVGSIFGGNGVNFGDTYVFTYKPGINADNTVYAANQTLGSTTGFPGQGNKATGLVGGVSGTYNVYFTSPSTTNVSGGASNFHVSNDAATVNLSFTTNDGGSGPDTDPGPAFVGGANNAWALLASNVHLTAGNTYTVSMDASANTFVSQRAHGVMWELVQADAIPEPATFVLAGLGLVGVGLVARRRSA